MYRSEETYAALKGRSVLQVAQDVHATARGVYHREIKDQVDDVKLLMTILQTWNLDTDTDYDRCVWRLAQAALATTGLRHYLLLVTR